MPDLLTICIPTYNRPDYLEQCLESIMNQKFDNYRVVILDNASTKDYSAVLKRSKDSRITYRHHAVNFGPDGNWLIALTEYLQSKYLMIFHDDDLMHPSLLESEIAIMEKKDHVQFVATAMTFFTDNPPCFTQPLTNPRHTLCCVHELVEMLLQGYPLHFGSVMYRSAVLHGRQLDTRRFAKIADRPFLLEIVKHGPCVLIHEPSLVLYRVHSNQGSKIGGLNEDHIIELYRAYREALYNNWELRYSWLYYKKTGFELLDSYMRLLPECRSPVISFLHKCRQAEVIRYPFLLFFPLIKLRHAIVRICSSLKLIIPKKFRVRLKSFIFKNKLSASSIL